MRVKLSQSDREFLFSRLQAKFKNLALLAAQLKASPRTIRDWRRGKYLMTDKNFELMLALADLNTSLLSPELLPDFWSTHKAGVNGALARMRLYGNPGTPEGRRKGGLAGMAAHRRNGNTTFVTLKAITKPEYSEKLAEFLGIMMGDGHVDEYQILFTTNSETDIQHAHFVIRMIQELFNTTPTLAFRKDQKAVDVVTSSRTLVNYMHEFGMPSGNKIENQITIPSWISDNEHYHKAFLRGLFDTDGCIYLDKHTIKGKIYRNMGWTFTNYADRLRADVYEALGMLGFSPTLTTPHQSVFLRRKNEIVRYFEEIGTHNNKHLARYQSFVNQ